MDLMELNFEGLEMQKWNIPTDRAQGHTLSSETIFDNWKLFKIDKKCFLFHLKKLFSFSRYLSFCYDLWFM